jgi:hypothetical protein
MSILMYIQDKPILCIQQLISLIPAIIGFIKNINQMKIKNPRPKGRGIEDFSLKSFRMWGNKSPTPPALRPKGRGIKPKAIKK